MKKPEILAPAGNFESLTAAVYAGANAVYLGSKSLNARQSAGNFDDAELAAAVRFCTQREVKVYQTINTVVFERELEAALFAVKRAAELGIAGVLVQDFAVADIVRTTAPDLPLFASTQMAIHNRTGVQAARRLGFSRAVLAREMSAEEIAACTGLGIETEVFVHGAHCMSVSGRCYMSSMIGGRSGNRGRCAQPCRLPARLVEEPYALSLKDMSLIDRIAELSELGVDSFKIEGRMKRPEYVAAAVTALKCALAGEAVDFDTLQSVFSRSGFTKGYYSGVISADMFGIRKKEDVTAAAPVLKSLAAIYEKEPAVFPVAAKVVFKSDRPLELVLTDNLGNTAGAVGKVPQPALKTPTSPEKLAEFAGRLGGTPFFLDKFECEFDDGLAVAASEVSALRRSAVEQLLELRAAGPSCGFYTEKLPPRSDNRPKFSRNLTLRARLAALTPEVISAAYRIVLPIDDCAEYLSRPDADPDKLVAEIPGVVFTGEQKIADKLTELAALGLMRAKCGNLWAVEAAAGAGLEPVGGFALNIATGAALEFFAREYRMRSAELSFEISMDDIRKMRTDMSVGAVVYGYLPLMAVRACPVKAFSGCGNCDGTQEIVDRTGTRFRVDCSGLVPRQTAEIFNAVPVWLSDRLPEFTTVSEFTLYFTRETPEEIADIVRAYAEGAGPIFPRGEYTRGLYYREVK